MWSEVWSREIEERAEIRPTELLGEVFNLG
jgi:hypothetical protein